MIKSGLLFIFLGLSFVGLSQSADEQHISFLYDTVGYSNNNEMIIVGEIKLAGNKKTVDRIIFRELVIKQGDTLTPESFRNLLKQSQENLLNRSLFNFVDIYLSESVINKRVKNVLISVTERWYIWPLPILEIADRNFNVWWKTKDFSKVNYGIYVTHNNFRGRNEKLKILIRAGYNQNYFLLYEIPYITRKQNFGIGFQIGESRSREIPYATEYDKHVYYKDENNYALTQFYSKIKFSYRDGIHNLHNLAFSYESYQFADTVLQLNPDFVSGNIPEIEMFTISYLFKHDFRDSKPYPLDGHYFDAEIMQQGLGYFETSPNIFTIKSSFDFYRPMGRRFFWASSLTVKVSDKDEQPFILTRGLGYGNEFVRSNELYVVDGQNYGLFKNNLKYSLLAPRNGKIPWIKTEKFNKIHYAVYLNLLFDAGYVHNNVFNPTSRLQNELIYGTGLGMDLVTYYDLVFRLEYSVNQFGEKGVYLHFMAPI
jgi:outer membrane protein assembly factor BamA